MQLRKCKQPVVSNVHVMNTDIHGCGSFKTSKHKKL